MHLWNSFLTDYIHSAALFNDLKQQSYASLILKKIQDHKAAVTLHFKENCAFMLQNMAHKE
jgi:hypothetical protein